jgi:putative membrane protein
LAAKFRIQGRFRGPLVGVPATPPDWFDGRRVVFTGMMLHDEQLKKDFGGRENIVYRFLINCCAADALPLAVAVDSDRARKMANDQWVRVEGIFHLCQIEGDAVPVVEDAAVQPVEAPKFPYLY